METNLKNKYKGDFQKVRVLVNELDPCGFIHSGSPKDEYDCLTNHLLSSVYQNKTREEIRSVILHEIDHHFGTPDRTIMLELESAQFYNDMETLLDKLEEQFNNKHSR